MSNDALLTELRITRDTVAFEAFQVAGIDIHKLAQDTIPTLVRAFNTVSSVFNPAEPGAPITADERAFLRLIESHKYLDLAHLPAYVPEGMEETYLNYAAILGQAVDHALEAVGMLNHFSTFIAMLITNREQQLMTKSDVRMYQNLVKDREGLLKEMAAAFKNGSHKTDVLYKDVINRNSDWAAVFATTDKLSKKVNGVDRKGLIKKVEETSGFLDKLAKLVADGKMENVSPEVVNELAEGAYQIASELEFFSVVYYRVLAYTTAVTRTTTSLSLTLTAQAAAQQAA